MIGPKLARRSGFAGSLEGIITTVARPDPAALCVSITGAVIGYGLLIRHGIAPGVVGYNLVPAEGVMNGQVPYRDFVYNYTPGLLWINALLFKLLNVSLLSARTGVWLAKVVSVVLLYSVGRRYLTGWRVLFPIAMTLAWVGYGDPLKVYPTQYGMPFLIAAWFFVLKAGESKQAAANARRLILAGVVAGIVFVFKQNVGLFTFAAACASGALSPTVSGSERNRMQGARYRIGLVVLGYSVPVTAMAAYLAARSALRPMAAHFIQHSIAYQESKRTALPHPSVLGPSAGIAIALCAGAYIVRRTRERWLPVYLSLALGFIILAAASDHPSSVRYEAIRRSLVADIYYLPIGMAIWSAIVVYSARKRQDFSGVRNLIIGLLFSLAAYLEIFPRSDPDHFIRVLPPSFIIFCALLTTDWKALSSSPANDGLSGSEGGALITHNRVNRGRAVTVAGVSTLVIVLGLKTLWAPLLDRDFRLADRTPLLFARGAGVMGDRAEANRLNKLVDYIQRSTSPDDSILAVSRKISSVYFFAARKNTTGLEWFESPGIPEAVREDVYRRISRQDFKLVIIGTELAEIEDSGTGEASLPQKKLVALVQQYYQESALIDGVTCFAPISAGGTRETSH